MKNILPNMSSSRGAQRRGDPVNIKLLCRSCGIVLDGHATLAMMRRESK